VQRYCREEGLQMMIDGKENPIAKMVIGILSTLSEKQHERVGKIISHIIPFSTISFL
jgi:hypothetical protein